MAAGVGVSLVPASVVELRDNGTTYKPLEDDAPPAKIAVAWRLGGLETLRRYGRMWFVLLARRRWKKIGAEALDRYRAEQLAAKAGAA